jgi:hypothetical protein
MIWEVKRKIAILVIFILIWVCALLLNAKGIPSIELPYASYEVKRSSSFIIDGMEGGITCDIVLEPPSIRIGSPFRMNLDDDHCSGVRTFHVIALITNLGVWILVSGLMARYFARIRH